MHKNNIWQAGFGKRDITPMEPIWLSGYGARDRPSEGVLEPIFVRVMVLTDQSGMPAVMVSADILGFVAPLSEEIQRNVEKKFDIAAERILLSATHNHASPVNTGVLPLIYNLSSLDEEKIELYTGYLKTVILEAVGDALADQEEVILTFAQGLAGFGVNRRRARPGCRHFPGPVDHDVPVLSACRKDGTVKGIAFGYACHTTALAGYLVHGDYAGFAQKELESRFPDAVALFLPGCAGDINPLPRGTVARAERHGKMLADAVEDVLGETGCILEEPLRVRVGTVDLRYDHMPSAVDLEKELADTHSIDKWMLHLTTIVPPGQRLPRNEAEKVAKVLTANERKSIRHQMETLRRDGRLPETCRLPVCVWNFGPNLKWIHLGGEPVVDYSLMLKRLYGWEITWVSGYYHDLVCYIPSLRVLREGDYEGTEGMREYGHPAAFDESVEQAILKEIECVIADDDDSSK